MSYKHTQRFSPIALDYVSEANELREFYEHSVSLEGIKSAIQEKTKIPVDRALLVSVLTESYKSLETDPLVVSNITALLEENTFTICTAHQPNIFTGHLYFVYKIMHAIKLCAQLKQSFPENNFVPVFYVGSEDADLEELGEISVQGKKYVWDTAQTGAVGRMKIDAALVKIVEDLADQLEVQPFGKEIMAIVEDAYKLNETVEHATLKFVNALFGKFGLIVLLPDESRLKKSFLPIAEKEIKTKFSEKAVAKTIESFPAKYKVQAAGRDINLFHLEGDRRDRISVSEGKYKITDAEMYYTEDELITLFRRQPEVISPNVILRPVLQEFILPNIAFIGGSGELAYWLELKGVFQEAAVPFPVLILRNSFEIISNQTDDLIKKLELQPEDFFSGELDIINGLVKKNAGMNLSLSHEKLELIKSYKTIRAIAAQSDQTLDRHVWALQQRAINKLSQLEKKMLSAARKKDEASTRQVKKINAQLFPTGNLQERVDNVLFYYAAYGPSFLQEIYEASLGLEQQFCILTAQNNG